MSKQVTVANGSGFIVRADGLIITNAHVVANRNAVNVKLYDGRQVEGRVVAVDPVSDLACVKINAVSDMFTGVVLVL
jgi:HtrA serine peptidase 2